MPTELRTDLWVDVLRNRMVLGALGVRILSGLTSTIDLPRKSSASTIGTLTEIGSASETNPNTAKVTLSPKRASAYVEVSKQAIIQSALALESLIRDDLIMSTAVMIENLAINGNGTAPQYTGLRNTTGMGTVVAGGNGLAPAWSHFVDLESACANANAEPDSLSGYLINTKTRGKLKQTQFATNLPMIWQSGPQPVNGYRVAVSNNVPSNLTRAPARPSARPRSSAATGRWGAWTVRLARCDGRSLHQGRHRPGENHAQPVRRLWRPAAGVLCQDRRPAFLISSRGTSPAAAVGFYKRAHDLGSLHLQRTRSGKSATKSCPILPAAVSDGLAAATPRFGRI